MSEAHGNEFESVSFMLVSSARHPELIGAFQSGYCQIRTRASVLFSKCVVLRSYTWVMDGFEKRRWDEKEEEG